MGPCFYVFFWEDLKKKKIIAVSICFSQSLENFSVSHTSKPPPPQEQCVFQES